MSKQEVRPDKVKKLLKDPEYIKIVDKIDANVDYIDIKPYSHNIIGLCLQDAAEKFGNDVANDLIMEFKLHMYGWSTVDTDD